MAITTYSELQLTIADFLNREDLSSIIPSFIDLAEARLNRAIRHWRMQTTTTISLDAQYVPLPADWLDTVRLSIVSDDSLVNLNSPQAVATRRFLTGDATGTPEYYALVGDDIELFPTPPSAINAELVYYQKIPALSDGAPTNWLLTNYPDIYLYGALMHSAPYLKDDARIPLWSQLYVEAMTELNRASDQARWSGGFSGQKLKPEDMQ